MFDIAWSEIFVVLVVGIILVKPEDIPKVIKGLKNFFSYLSNIKNELASVFKDIDYSAVEEDGQNKKYIKKTIIDLEGNEQEIFDISDLKPISDFLKKENNKDIKL